MKRLIFILVFLTGLAQNGFAQMSAIQAEAKFKSANQYYREGKYAEAVKEYEKILNEGKWESGPLYYNLGNSYFREGNLGQAVLNYERAKRFIPRDSDLQFNTRYALAQVKNYGGSSPAGFSEWILSKFVNRYIEGEWVIFLLIIGMVLGIISLLALFLNWPANVRRNILIGLCALFILCAAALFIRVQSNRDLAVILKDTSTKYEPKENSTTYFHLSEGMEIKILKKEGHWVKIKRHDGKLGWIPQEDLEKI